MGALAETIAQKARLSGAKASLRVRGRDIKLSSGNQKDDESELKALIDDAPQMMDPDRPAQARNPVYTFVSVLAQSLQDPTALTSVVEVNTEKTYKVLEFLETAGDRIWWKFRCEAQREVYE